MDMDISTLDSWVTTTGGSAWLDSQKAGLIAKRDELLTAQKTANGKIAELELRLGETESRALDADAFIHRHVVSDALERLLMNTGVADAFLPIVKKAVLDGYAIQLKRADGDFIACGTIKDADGADVEAGLEAIVEAWAKLPEAQQLIVNRNSGGGATGSTCVGVPQPKLQGMTGRQLATMSDNDFQAARQNELRGKK